MQELSKSNIVLVILDLIGILCGLVTCILTVLWAKDNALLMVASVITMLALAFALIYLCMGFSKPAAKFYRLFVYTFAFAELANLADIIVASSAGDQSRVDVIVSALTFAFILIPTFYENFGKAKSIVLCAIVLGLRVFMFIASLCGLPLFADMTASSAALVRGISFLALTFVMCVMILCKYADKAARGTK